MSSGSDHIAIERAFRIGSITVRPGRNHLSSPRGERKLEPKIMDVLCCLSGHAHTTLARETLLAEVWEQRFGGDESLTRAVSILRRTLADLEPGTEFIETVPKRGYRFRVSREAVAANNHVARDNADRDDPSENDPTENDMVVLRLHRGTLAVSVVLLLIIGNMSLRFGPSLVEGAQGLIADIAPARAEQSGTDESAAEKPRTETIIHHSEADRTTPACVRI